MQRIGPIDTDESSFTGNKNSCTRNDFEVKIHYEPLRPSLPTHRFLSPPETLSPLSPSLPMPSSSRSSSASSQ
ncbi:unnamed protein product [Linum trigynum]|uniref:Uncharacterized protein n=1 Tax=Linum trigynum TaxID=586398 RepID=A0AAV2D6D3_9ROSI